MSVKINGQTIMQPSSLQEAPVYVQTDVTSLDGSEQRNYVNTKYQVDMSWDNLTISGYQQILSFVAGGASVVYTNDFSAQIGGSLTISGLPMPKFYPYVKGASLWQQLDLSIRQT